MKEGKGSQSSAMLRSTRAYSSAELVTGTCKQSCSVTNVPVRAARALCWGSGTSPRAQWERTAPAFSASELGCHPPDTAA